PPHLAGAGDRLAATTGTGGSPVAAAPPLHRAAPVRRAGGQPDGSAAGTVTGAAERRAGAAAGPTAEHPRRAAAGELRGIPAPGGRGHQPLDRSTAQPAGPGTQRTGY